MTTITLEVPDDLATQLQRDPALMQALLREVVNAKSAQVASLAMRAVSVPPVYQEIVDFLATSPTPEALGAFKISEVAQERLEDLLDKNREAALTPDERVELETYRQLNHLVIRLQARALCGQPLLTPRPQSADHATPPHS
jgi:predicted transcriptional regulator